VVLARYRRANRRRAPEPAHQLGRLDPTGQVPWGGVRGPIPRRGGLGREGLDDAFAHVVCGGVLDGLGPGENVEVEAAVAFRPRRIARRGRPPTSRMIEARSAKIPGDCGPSGNSWTPVWEANSLGQFTRATDLSLPGHVRRERW